MTPWKSFSLAMLLVAGAGIALLVVLIARGFRASTEPSRLETTVARAVRNVAIPAAARTQKNPLRPTAENLQAGRDAFLGRVRELPRTGRLGTHADRPGPLPESARSAAGTNAIAH